ncbi:hypothetical protein [Exiguobacterium sp. TNDT2]|uniref:hypothetical protein n=1 Tax=Exiguobacterium sp. TNDT2 TaxID=2233531 RepID=UPI000DEEE8D2|nr:hypothetical protein [Exiguobacterium sp. TNDT2]
MEQQLQQEIRWVQRMHKLAIPIWITYVMALIAALIVNKDWLILLMFFVAVLTMYMSYRQYRIMRHISNRGDVHRLLKLKMGVDWIGSILLFTFFATLLTVESVGLLLGVVLATWSMTDTARSRFIQRKINACDPTMPTYDEVMERMS